MVGMLVQINCEKALLVCVCVYPSNVCVRFLLGLGWVGGDRMMMEADQSPGMLFMGGEELID